MSDEDDMDFTSTNQSSKNLASLFQSGEPTVPLQATAYVPPKQPKKDSPTKIMIATAVQAFSFGADQKWTSRGKMGVALLSTDNTVFQLILYVTKTQHVTSVRINATTNFTSQLNNYLAFQDDAGQNWSIMFENKQAFIDFILQILLAKACILSFKFDHIVQDIIEGEGPPLTDNDGVEITVKTYKLLENKTISSVDSTDIKPGKYKIGKQQNGKAFDDCLRGMKKNGQRIAMIGTIFCNIEVVRVKREKEGRSSSITTVTEEQIIPERKRTITEDPDVNSEKAKMLQRISKIGGVSMFPTQNQPSAFVPPVPPHLSSISDDDSINNEIMQNILQERPVPTPVPPVQFVPPTYVHHLHSLPPAQHTIPQTPLYQTSLMPQQQQQHPLHDFNSRPGSSMSGMAYQQVSMWPPTQYPPNAPNMPQSDLFYQQQYFQNDFRQLFNRLTEKIDTLNEKFDTKNSITYPNMETSILLSNIQRIVKENENVKKDLFDRSAKVEELNLKISELLDRNQRLIEQTHQTAEQRNVVVNNVSEQTAQKILDLERQKVELTNNLSTSTSKISELQLQLNQHTKDFNENQTRSSGLLHKCEQYQADLEKSETQRSEIQLKLDAFQEQLKLEKNTRKQLQINFETIQEELNETKVSYANLEKINNERRGKYENERKRWQDDMDEQKHNYEKELDELRNKLRKQRTADSVTNNQEINRLEQDLEQQWQEKLERQQTQHERLLNAKGKEFEQLKTLFNENQTKLQRVNEELDQSKQQIETYEQQRDKLLERLTLAKERLEEMNDEQAQLVNEQVKRAINIIFRRLKARIQPTKQYTGEQFLSRSLEIIKQATMKILSNDDNDEISEEEHHSNDEDQPVSTANLSHENDQPVNGNSVDRQTLNEEVSSTTETTTKIPNQNEENNNPTSEVTSVNNQKNGWDTVDDLPQESKLQSEPPEQTQIVVVPQNTTSSDNENETIQTTSTVDIENTQVETSSSEFVEKPHDSDGDIDTSEENDKESPTTLEVPPEKESVDNETDKESFQPARPSLQDAAPSSSTAQSSIPPLYKFTENIPLMTNADDSDDEIFK